MQMQIAEQHLENLELRRALHSARQASDPHIAQVVNMLLLMFELHYITVHYITLHYIPLHYITLHGCP
jgi:hypothetical protein